MLKQENMDQVKIENEKTDEMDENKASISCHEVCTVSKEIS